MADEIRKTSLGMQAVGVAPLELVADERAPRRSDGTMHAWGLAVTVSLHAAVLALVVFMNEWERDHAAKIDPQPYQAIEAGLAIKKKSTSAPKSKMPQKEPAPKV